MDHFSILKKTRYYSQYHFLEASSNEKENKSIRTKKRLVSWLNINTHKTHIRGSRKSAEVLICIYFPSISHSSIPLYGKRVN